MAHELRPSLYIYVGVSVCWPAMYNTKQPLQVHTQLASKMGRTRLVLFLIAIFIVNTTQASAPAWNDGNGKTMPAWVQPRDRQLLNLMVRDMHVDIVVAKDGSGNYTTITEAVDAARPVRGRSYVIYINRGIYHEDVVVKKNKIVLIGDGINKTVITGNRSKAGGLASYDTAVVCKCFSWLKFASSQY